MKQKDVVLIPFPFSDSNERKVRPALIMSNDIFNKQSIDYILIPITSVLKSVPYSIPITQQNLASGKLIVPSRIRTDKIFTIDKKRIIMKIGTLDDGTFDNVRRDLLNVFS